LVVICMSRSTCARQHRIDLDEVLLGDAVAVVGVQLELAAVAVEQLAQERVVVGRLLEQALVDHVADVGAGQVHAQAGREAVLQLHDGAGLGRVVELLLAGGQEPHLAPELLPQRRHEGLELEHPIVHLVHVLADLVDHQEQRLARLTQIEHGLDGLHHLLHRAAAAVLGASAAVDPAHRLQVPLRVHGVEHVREVIVGLLVPLGLAPRPPQDLLRGGLEQLILTVALQLQLVLGHQVALLAVAEARLHLAQHGRVDVLVVAGHRADVEHHRDRLHLGVQRGPRGGQLRPLGGVVAGQQRLGQRAAVGQAHAVEGQAQELGEARLTGAVEAGDPAGGQLGAALLVQLARQRLEQVHQLLVDAGLHAARARVAVGIAAGDDVLGDLGRELVRALLVEVDDGRDVARDVGGEDLLDTHGWRSQVSAA
jgi:hypothetical protein